MSPLTPRTIYFYREGVFYKAYERSAYLFVKYAKPFQVKKRVKANGNYEKREFIEKARERMVVIKLNIRVLHDMKQISLKQFAMLADRMESVSKQLASWERYLRKVNSER